MNHGGNMSELITVKKLEERISIPAWTIRKMTREKRLPAYKVGRGYLYDPEEVIESIKNRRGK
jgi:excisionase family DNA binding protein